MSHTSSVVMRDGGLSAAIGRGTLYGTLANLAQAGTRFIMVPIVIAHLGLAGYGIWNIVMATATYMRFGSAGAKSAFQKYVADSTVDGEFDKASRLLSTGGFCILGLSFAALLPLAAFAPALAHASGVPPEFLASAARSIALLAVIMVISNFGSVFEAIVMGGHRIDLTRKFIIATTLGDATVIVILLHLGYGLFAMAVTMAVSELTYLTCCFVAARRIVPRVRIGPSYFTTGLLPELVRYAGSYQLVNILEVLYALFVPVVVLKYYGAGMSGIYAVGSRLAGAALMAHDALILPLLSGGALALASGSLDQMRLFFLKAFKSGVAATSVPLGFVAAFGGLLVLAWTGQVAPVFRVSVGLLCLSAFFGSISRIQLILYRASGRALHDNVRQAFRLAALVILAAGGARLGFSGILVGLAAIELIGVVYMFAAITRAMPFFTAGDLIPDAVRLVGFTALTIAAGGAATMLPLGSAVSPRAAAIIHLGAAVAAGLAASWPALALAKPVSVEERNALLRLLPFQLPFWRARPGLCPADAAHVSEPSLIRNHTS